MTISTVLKVIYASAPTDVVILPTLEIRIGSQVIRLVNAYEGMQLGVDGVMQEFEPTAMDVALPVKDTSGNQSLTFAIEAVDGRPYKYVCQGLADGVAAKLIYREYLSTDLSTPAKAPIEMTILGGEFEGVQVQIRAAYYDMLNLAWPRERYTSAKAPGIKYMT